MEQYKVIMSIALLVASAAILFNQLLASQPIQIVLETGQVVDTQSSGYFSLLQALIIASASFLIGSTSIYLYFKSETEEFLKSLGKKNDSDKRYEMVLPLLRDEERTVFRHILDNRGEMLQNALVLKTSLSKVKMTRVLSSLERKNLVVKERHGLTNRIRLK